MDVSCTYIATHNTLHRIARTLSYLHPWETFSCLIPCFGRYVPRQLGEICPHWGTFSSPPAMVRAVLQQQYQHSPFWQPRGKQRRSRLLERSGQLCDDFGGVEGESSQIRSGEWCQRIAKAFKKRARAGFEGKHRPWFGHYVPEKIRFSS